MRIDSISLECIDGSKWTSGLELVEWITGLNYRIGLLDLTTGLDYRIGLPTSIPMTRCALRRPAFVKSAILKIN
jgi:hypothetical protein